MARFEAFLRDSGARLFPQPCEVDVCEPFFGLGSGCRVLETLGLTVNYICCCDTDDRLAIFHADAPRGRPEQKAKLLQQVSLGKKRGDMLKVALEDLQDSDVLFAGPHCQAFASCGKRKHDLDPRAKFIERVTEWIIELGRRGRLVAYFLENSGELLNCRAGEPPLAAAILDRLQLGLPYFRHGPALVHMDAFHPHHRERCWLRGVRLDYLFKVNGTVAHLPAPLVDLGFGRIGLADLLTPGPPCCGVESFSRGESHNYSQYLKMIETALALGTHGEIAVFQLDRDPTCRVATKGRLWWDRVPSLRRGGGPVFVMSIDDLDLPVAERRFHRRLRAADRFALQGYGMGQALGARSENVMKSMTGNAYPLPMVAQVALPVLELLSSRGWPYIRNCLRAQDLECLAARGTAAVTNGGALGHNQFE